MCGISWIDIHVAVVELTQVRADGGPSFRPNALRLWLKALDRHDPNGDVKKDLFYQLSVRTFTTLYPWSEMTTDAY